MHSVAKSFIRGMVAMNTIIACAGCTSQDGKQHVSLDFIAFERAPATESGMLRAKFLLSNKSLRTIEIQVTTKSTIDNLVASKPGFEVMTDDGEWVDAFVGYDFALPPHRIPAYAKREIVVNLSRLVPVDGVVPLSLDDLWLPASGVRLPITARVTLSFTARGKVGTVRSEPFQIRESDVIAVTGTTDRVITTLVAFGIKNEADTWDYCLIDNSGHMECVSFLGFDSNADPSAGGDRKYWLNHSYTVPDADMERLRQLLSEENVVGAAEEYNGSNADGMERYLAIHFESGPRIMYFDLPLPPSAVPLISHLETLRQNATTSGLSREATL